MFHQRRGRPSPAPEAAHILTHQEHTGLGAVGDTIYRAPKASRFVVYLGSPRRRCIASAPAQAIPMPMAKASRWRSCSHLQLIVVVVPRPKSGDVFLVQSRPTYARNGHRDADEHGNERHLNPCTRVAFYRTAV